MSLTELQEKFERTFKAKGYKVYSDTYDEVSRAEKEISFSINIKVKLRNGKFSIDSASTSNRTWPESKQQAKLWQETVKLVEVIRRWDR